MQREITTVLETTSVGVDAWVIVCDGRVLLADRVHGKVRFSAKTRGATNDLAKHIAKRLKCVRNKISREWSRSRKIS